MIKLKKNDNLKYLIIFICIIAGAVFIRFYNWPNAITQVNCDEIMTAVNAKSIADTGKDLYGTSYPVYLEAWGGMGQSVFLLYSMVLCIKIFGYSLAAVRLPMLIISVISLFVFYDLARRICKNKYYALIFLAIAAFSPWHILQSIWSIDCNMFPHIMLISVYFLYIGAVSNKIFVYISMVFFALCLYTYGVSIYAVPIFLIAAAIYLMKTKRIKVFELLICIIMFLIIALPIILMYVINFLHIENDIHIGKMTIQYFENNTRTSDMLLFSDNILKQLGVNILSLLQIIFIQFDGLEWNATLFFGATFHISLVFAAVGFIQTFKQKKYKELGQFLFLLWFLISIFTGLLINHVNINRLNIVWFPLLFFSAYGLYYVFKKFGNKKIVIFSISAIYTILILSYNIYFHTNYNLSLIHI